MCGTADGAVQRRRKILLVPPALRARPAELNCDFAQNASPSVQTRRGAPVGNRNALRQGRFTRDAYRHRAERRAGLRAAKDRLRTANALYREVRLLEARFALSQALEDCAAHEALR